MIGLRDTFIDQTKARVAGLARQLAAGELATPAWEKAMREEIKTTHLAQAMLGRGGRKQMTPADWGRCGQAIRAQYGFLGAFADAADTLSEAQVVARAALYVASSTASYERGQAAAWGVELPAYPGDHSTICGANCACDWLLTEEAGAIHATWQTNAGETCADCAARAVTWAPLVFAGEAVAA